MPTEIQGFHKDHTTVDGVKLTYWIGGEPHSKPVLLWHGFLGTSYSWRKVMPLLAAAGFWVLAPDMRGYGDSDKPGGDANYDGAGLMEDFRALCRQIGFARGRRLLLVAHDMGAPPALVWAGSHPEEIAGLIYAEAPTMLNDVLQKLFVYSPVGIKAGFMWWWILPLIPTVPERLIVGHESQFLRWFYETCAANSHSIDEDSIREYLRTFHGEEGVLGSLGVYRTAFTTAAQTAQFIENKLTVPVLAVGGAKALGAKVEEMLSGVTQHLSGIVLPNCGHFVQEEQPGRFTGLVEAFYRRIAPS